jgi:RNA polymerase sigma-B factor
MPMAVRLARRFRNRGESFEDLRQVAQLGLVRAVSRFDPDFGTAFANFALPTIVGEVKRHFRDCLWAVHVPRRVQELRMEVRSALNELCRSLDDHGPPGIRDRRAHRPDRAGSAAGPGGLESFTTLSLEAPQVPYEDDYSLAETLGCAEPGFDRVVDREALRPLPEREQQILYLRFFCEMTQIRIAEQLGISQMHVSRLIIRTCAQLRDQVMAGAA